MIINPNYAVAEFAEDARQRVRDVLWYFKRPTCLPAGRQQSRFGEIGNCIIRDQIYPLIDRYVKIQTEVIADYAENIPSAAVIVYSPTRHR